MDAMVVKLSTHLSSWLKMKFLMKLVPFIELEDMIMVRNAQVSLNVKPVTQALTNATLQIPTKSSA